jgi:eukaryotic-like serine/threonine-protein kinase
MFGFHLRPIHIVLDINQPGRIGEEGTYHAGKIIGRVLSNHFQGPLPSETLLYGRLWTEGLTKYGHPAVLARYTEALLPDGRRLPVCIIPDGDETGLLTKLPNSKPGAARLYRQYEVGAVRRWP